MLTFAGEDILTGVSLPEKLKIVARYCPVFVLTTFFRIGCITSTTFLAGVGNDGFGVYAYVAQIEFATPLIFAVPLLVLLLLKRLLPMVTIGQLVQGVVGETFTITVWGQSGKEGRRLQLAMAVYHLVLHTIAAIAVLTTIPHHRASVFLTGFSLTAVGCGWIAFILFIFRFSSNESE